MAKEFINGKSACTKLGCTKEFFHHLVEIGELEAERTETGSWRVSRESVDAVKSKLNTVRNTDDENQIHELIDELEFLKGQVEHYKKILREIQRIIPQDL